MSAVKILLFALMTSSVCGNFFTSSQRMMELAELEETLLHALRHHDTSQQPFVDLRLAQAEAVGGGDYRDIASHPNGAYLLLKTFITRWNTLIVREDDTELPTHADLQGALAAILRLQTIYDLSVSHMYAGNYSGYLGPPLSPEDAYLLGKLAFVDSDLNESREWLELAEKELESRDVSMNSFSNDEMAGESYTHDENVRTDSGSQKKRYSRNMMQKTGEESLDQKISVGKTTESSPVETDDRMAEKHSPDKSMAKEGSPDERMTEESSPDGDTPERKRYADDQASSLLLPGFSLATVQCLLGRAYLHAGQLDKAKEKHHQSLPFATKYHDVEVLGQELTSDIIDTNEVKDATHVEFEQKSKHLCSRHRNHNVEEIRVYHICRLKRAETLPYVVYKEEILSVTPFVSVFYDVISDNEIQGLMEHAESKLQRSIVESADEGESESSETSDDRVSNTAGVSDDELRVAARLSGRIQDITGLRTYNKPGPNTTVTAETLQVVNYGLGGHYSLHYDHLENNPGGTALHAGERIATFLIYLSDVEMGGNTIFPHTGISVSPVKGAALLWYNFSPAMQHEDLTLHAGCPVLKGHKWIANKWIWTYGNTFFRPCGPNPNSSQLDVEKIKRL